MITREVFGRFIFSLSKVYPKHAPDFSDQFVFQWWFDAFKNCEIDELKAALLKIKDTCEEFPSIKKLKTVIQTGMDCEKSVGEDVAARIESAIAKFGYINPADAETSIGTLGWAVVNSIGGWSKVCSVTHDELPSARRQWREFAITLARKAISGDIHDAPTLTSGNKIKNLLGHLSENTLDAKGS